MKNKKITTFNLEEEILEDLEVECEEQNRSRSNMANRIFEEFFGKKKKVKK